MSTAIPPLTIAGSLSQSGSSLSGAVHVDALLYQRTAIVLTGTLTNGNVSLTSLIDRDFFLFGSGHERAAAAFRPYFVNLLFQVCECVAFVAFALLNIVNFENLNVR